VGKAEEPLVLNAPTFMWCLHQPAAARWLKQDVARLLPELRFAFAGPGLTTFKLPAGTSELPMRSSFARATGWSLGRATSVTEVLALTAGISAALGRDMNERPMRLHVFERDPDLPADERDPIVVGTRPRIVEQALRDLAPAGRFHDDAEARDGDVILDVITAASESADESLFVGWHQQISLQGRWPGGVPHVPIPERSPSRAWAKIEEAILWSGLVPAAGEVAIEIGSAPGGASFALLERGLSVHGIDPGAMAPIVRDYVGKRGNRFTHHMQPAAQVDRRALPQRMDWLANDVNLAPMVTLNYVERMVALMGPPARGAFLTLKINDDGVFDALPRLQERVERVFPATVDFVQLPAHRSEIVAIMKAHTARKASPSRARR
jgi:23S rRNA (cytidine2498-2'-O)-methyltransferase